MSSTRRTAIAVVAGVLAVFLTVAGCSQSSSDTASPDTTPSAAPSVELSADALVVDVRTP